MNNDTIIKCKISNSLGTALKQILDKLGTSQQEFLEKQIEKFVLDNLLTILKKDSTNEKWKNNF